MDIIDKDDAFVLTIADNAFDPNLLICADYDLFFNVYDGVHETSLGLIMTYTVADFIM